MLSYRRIVIFLYLCAAKQIADVMRLSKYILFVIFVFIAAVNAAAQGLVVKNFYLAERDFTANSGSTLVPDVNDEPCALIKVRTNEKGFTFDAGRLLPVEKTEEQRPSHPLEIYVWVQSGAKRLSIGHKQLGNLYDYDLGMSLEAGKTYILELVTGEVQTIVKQARTNQWVVFQLTPPEAVVELDGQIVATSDGTAQKLMPFGSYQYTVKAPDYQMEVGRVTVNDPKNKHMVTVTLKPNFAQITVKAPNGAEIWVDEERKGTGSWTGNLGAGAHIFEARLSGHRPTQRDYNLVVENGPQTIDLAAPTPILGEVEITSNPALADIYIDGKKVGQTPQLVSDLLVGSHSIKLSRNGYADYTGTLIVKEGETTPLTATLKKQETPAVGGSSATANAAGNLTFTVKGVKFTMVKVEAGAFQMGSNDGLDRGKPVHRVTISKDYYMGQTEVTQALWKAVMGDNPSEFKGDNLPVEKVSWDDCQRFITKLNSLTGAKFRLPTEAEWEFAARGGNKSRGYKYSGSNTNDRVAWYYENSGDSRLDDSTRKYDKLISNKCRTHPVGTKSANELGIYDMSGNVWEWCYDWYGDYSSTAQTDPTGPTSGSFRVNRGGSWFNDAASCRVANRNRSTPSNRSSSLGFRLAL